MQGPFNSHTCDGKQLRHCLPFAGPWWCCPHVRPNYFLLTPARRSLQSNPHDHISPQRDLISFLHKLLSWSERLFMWLVVLFRWDNDFTGAGVNTLVSVSPRSFKLSANIHQLQIGVKLKRRPAGERPRQAGRSAAAVADVDERF